MFYAYNGIKDGPMKYFKKLKLFKSSNLTLDPETGKGYSYEWYRIVDRIDGMVVLNNYSYSPTTCRHISKIRSMLTTLGVREYLEIEAPGGLQDLDKAIEYYEGQINELNQEIAKPRSSKIKNLDRYDSINKYKDKITLVKALKEGNRNE